MCVRDRQHRSASRHIETLGQPLEPVWLAGAGHLLLHPECPCCVTAVSWASWTRGRSSFSCRTHAEDCHPPCSPWQHNCTWGTRQPSQGSKSWSTIGHSRLRATQAGRRQGRDIPQLRGPWRSQVRRPQPVSRHGPKSPRVWSPMCVSVRGVRGHRGPASARPCMAVHWGLLTLHTTAICASG